jgi:plasmid stabilization system protein ParE
MRTTQQFSIAAGRETLYGCHRRLLRRHAHVFPHRRAQRDDVRPGLRVTNYKGSVVIAFAVDDAASTVTITGVYYGGQDYESVLHLGLD